MKCSERAGSQCTVLASYRFISVSLAIGLVWLTVGCDQVASLFSTSISGDVFVRMGSGDTRPQGGLEVVLVAQPIDDDLKELQAEFNERQAEHAGIVADVASAAAESHAADAALKDLRASKEQLVQSNLAEANSKIATLNKRLTAALAAERRRFLDLIDVKLVRSEYIRPHGWLNLYLEITNRTPESLTVVRHTLSCKDQPIETIGDSSMILTSGASAQDRESLAPGDTLIPTLVSRDHYPETFYLSGDKSIARRCRTEDLRISVVGAGLWDEDLGKTSFSLLDRLVETAESLQLRQALAKARKKSKKFSSPKLEELSTRILDTVGVAGSAQGKLAAARARRRSFQASGVYDLDRRLLEAVAKHTVATTRTGIDGSYSIPKISRGNYYLFVVFQTAVEESTWFVPVEAAGDVKQDLSNHNMSDPRFASRWERLTAD